MSDAPRRRSSGQPAAERQIPPAERVYCNRKLKMSRVQAIGFDMDHTLAIYRRDIEDLAYRLTAEKLVDRGYPEELLSLSYDRDLAIRGLVIDKDHGNVIKIDRYKYVTDAFHGTHRMTYDERKDAYSKRRLDLADPSFHNLDTLFTIPEAVLFAQIVDLADAEDPPRWSYRKLFDDIRECIDEAHRDNSLKSRVKADLSRYFVRDPKLPETLVRFRKAGKKVFLLTNSGLEYTEKVMAHILPPGPQQDSWKDYFDVIGASARKPAFFAEGTPLELLEAGTSYKLMTGGNVEKLEALLEVGGDSVLYFGDHTFGDIMKSKKYSLWRTAMVVEELAEELDAAAATRPQRSRLERLYLQKSSLADQIAHRQEKLDALRRFKLGEAGRWPRTRDLPKVDAQMKELERELRNLDKRLTTNLQKIKRHEVKIWSAYNPHWGPLFRAGTEKSRVGDQIEDFACVYTTKVSNFLHYPVNKYFQSPRERMVHELG